MNAPIIIKAGQVTISVHLWSAIMSKLGLSVDAPEWEIFAAVEGWINKDDLTVLWKDSAMAALIDSERAKTDPAYKAAVERFQDLVLSLSGKNLSLTEADQKWLEQKLEIAKADRNTRFGRYVARRLRMMCKPKVDRGPPVF